MFGFSPDISISAKKKKYIMCQQPGATFCSQQHLGQVCDETPLFSSQMGAHLPASWALILELQVQTFAEEC